MKVQFVIYFHWISRTITHKGQHLIARFKILPFNVSLRYKSALSQANPAVLVWLYNSALITKGSRRPQFRLVRIVLYINYQLLMKTLSLRTVQQLNIVFWQTGLAENAVKKPRPACHVRPDSRSQYN